MRIGTANLGVTNINKLRVERLTPKVIDQMHSKVRTAVLPRRPDPGGQRWGLGSALVIALLVCIALLAVSCGTDDVTVEDDITVETVGQYGPDSGGNSTDEEPSHHDVDQSPPRPTGDPSEGSESALLVRMPEVVGLSSDEALARLEASGLNVGFDLHDVPEPGVEDETVTGSDHAPGTLIPLGSRVTLDVYIDNQPDTSPVDPAELALRRIARDIRSDFGQRYVWSHWDEPTGTITFRIIDLSTNESGRLRTRYDNENFPIAFSSTGVNYAELKLLKESVSNRIWIRNKCSRYLSSMGINLVDWSVFVTFSLKEYEDQAIDEGHAVECISEMKQAALSVSTDFVKDNSITADPADLVRFETFSVMPD